MARLAFLVTLMFGQVMAALAQTSASAEAPVETVGAWAIWLFGLLFVGACVWFVMAVMRGEKSDKQQ